MKKIGILLAMCLLLAGCGSEDVASVPAASAPGASAEPWGVQMESREESGLDSEIPSALETMTTPTPGPTPTPSPSPTPTPTPLPISLTETEKAGPQVLADGVSLTSLDLGGDTYVKASDLEAVYPWLTLTRDAERASVTAYDGTVVPLTFVETDGRAMLPEPGEIGIHFVGQQEEDWLPLRYVAEQTGLYLLWDPSVSTAYVTKMPDTNLIAQGRSVPIWMYHEVGDNLWGIESLFVSPSSMREQLQYLQDNGYDTIFFSDLTHLEDYDKPVILTFDDGYLGTYTELFPLLKEFGMKATVFVITASIGSEYDITAEQAKEMSDSGLVEIESHTVNHNELAQLGPEEQESELRQSQLDIARITGKIPYVLSYPNGSHNDTTIELAKKYYDFAIIASGGKWTTDGHYYTIPRLYAARTTTMDTFSSAMR